MGPGPVADATGSYPLKPSGLIRCRRRSPSGIRWAAERKTEISRWRHHRNGKWNIQAPRQGCWNRCHHGDATAIRRPCRGGMSFGHVSGGSRHRL